MSAISSVNLYRQMNNASLINRMAMSSITGASNIGQVNRASSISSIPAYKNTARGGLGSDTLSFVKNYQSSMTKMMESANALRDVGSKSILDDMEVVSSNTNVASASLSYSAYEAGSYEMNVQQLAAAQVNQSQAINTLNSDLSGTLSLQTSKGTFQFQADGAASGNREALNSLVSEINRAKTGVTASLSLTDNGKTALTLTSDATGESNAFAASGSLADSLGLSTATTEAQNAVYTVKKSGSLSSPIQRTSETNSVYVDEHFRVKADLKSTGSTNITVSPNSDKVAEGIQSMVDNFNSTLKLLNDNADRGTGVLKQIRRMVLPPTSEKSMNLIGVSTNKDGTLSFDKSTFKKASAQNPSLVKQVVGGSFGLASGVYNDAQQGLRVSSNTLLSEDLKAARLSAAYDPVNLMGTYSKSGAYNMSNTYAVNMLINMMV